MVRNSPCSVCFLTSKPLRPGRIELFVVCLVSIGCSLLFLHVSYYRTNLRKQFAKGAQSFVIGKITRDALERKG